MSVNKRKSALFKRYNGEYFAFVLPMAILFFVFFILPFCQSFYYSLTNWSGISLHPKFVGLRNFVNIFTKDSEFLASFLFTLKYTVICIIAINLVSMLLANVLTSRLLFEKKLRMLFFIPNTIGIVIIGMIWNFIMGPMATELAQKTGIALFGLNWLTNPTLALLSVSFATLWASLGWYMLIYVAGFESIPMELLEASRMEGCGSFREFIHVKLPLIVPSITICVFLTITNGLKIFDLLWTMTSGGPGKATESVIMNIYNTSFDAFLYGYGIAKSLILVVVIAVIGMAQVYFTKRKEVSL